MGIKTRMSAEGRRRALIFPREHGAWGLFLIPLATAASVGLAAGGRALPLLPLSIAALALFWLRTPVEVWIGTALVQARTPAEVQVVRNAVLALAAVSIAALIWLFWGGRNGALLWIGAGAAAAFIVQAMVRQVWRNARTAAQMIGAAGLTLAAPAAYYVVTGQLDHAAWSLWIANLLFAMNQIQFVQLRIHAARPMAAREKLAAGWRFLLGQAVLMAILTAACAGHIFAWYAALAFVPVLFRGFAWFASGPEPLAVHTLGRRELIHSGTFGVLLVLGVCLGA